MHRILAVFLALAAFLAVSLYWLWQILTGRPALAVEEIAWRALLAMLAAFLAGLFVGRLGISAVAEAWQEACARRRDRDLVRIMKRSENDPETGDPRQAGSGGVAQQ
jgi:hypothetical protein